MPHQYASVLIAAALGSASAAVAQPASAPSTTVAPVTVTAAPTPKAVEKQTHSFVQTYAAPANPEVDQIGRWQDPVCVQVEGLIPAQASMVKTRIESVAQAVGLHAARPGCRANVEIVFSDKPQAVMDDVAKRRDYLLGYYHAHERDRLKVVSRPIQTWYRTETRGQGANVGAIFSSYAPYVQTETDVIDDPANQVPDSCGESLHFTACLKSQFNNVFMVADSKALQGKSLGLIADYMVMLALSQPRSLDGCNALPSVIDVLAKAACPGRDPPDGLTPADAAYLTALYDSDPESKRTAAQDDIANHMAKMLNPAKAVAR